MLANIAAFARPPVAREHGTPAPGKVDSPTSTIAFLHRIVNARQMTASLSTLEAGLKKFLDRHGFCFQYAVLKEIARIVAEGARNWVLAGSEVPVESKGKPTHIDFVLRHEKYDRYLICECKRANPKLSNWCFLRRPISTPFREKNSLLAEKVVKSAEGKVATGPDLFGTSENIWDLGAEMTSDMKGDPCGQSRKGLEAAMTQVMRQVNGFANLIGKLPSVVGTAPPLFGRPHAILVPVIFTSARLFTSESDISESDLLTGELKEVPSLKNADWLFYQYHQSPLLLHDLARESDHDNLEQFVMDEFTRTIAIVSARGIEKFFRGGNLFLR